MATTTVNTTLDPAITPAQNLFVSPALYSSTSTVNTTLDTQFNTTPTTPAFATSLVTVNTKIDAQNNNLNPVGLAPTVAAATTPVTNAITVATLNTNNIIGSGQVQSNWEETDPTQKDYIKNKPQIFSGNYLDLTNKPAVISTINTLTDVVISGVTEGQVLTYDGFNWINKTNTGSGGSQVLVLEPSFEFKNTDFHALSGNRYGVDTSDGAITVILPSSPKIGDAIYFIDFGDTVSTNNLTISRNGKTIMKQNEDLIVTIDGQSFGLAWSGTTWLVY